MSTQSQIGYSRSVPEAGPPHGRQQLLSVWSRGRKPLRPEGREIVRILALIKTGWEALAEFGLRTLGEGLWNGWTSPKPLTCTCVILKQHLTVQLGEVFTA